MLGISGKNTIGIKAPDFDGSQVCAQTDPDLFFPESAGESRIKMAIVKPLCDSCEFKVLCLEYAVARPELQGIWAGTTEKDRQRIRRERRLLA